MLVNIKSVRNHIPCCAACHSCTAHDDWNVAYLNEQGGIRIGAQMKLSPCSKPELDRMYLEKPQKSKKSRLLRSGIRPEMFQIKKKAVNGLASVEIRARHETVHLIRWPRIFFFSFSFLCKPKFHSRVHKNQSLDTTEIISIQFVILYHTYVL